MADRDGDEHDKAHVHGVEHKNGVGDNAAAHLNRQFASSTAEEHHARTKKLLRKVDVHLLPLLILM